MKQHKLATIVLTTLFSISIHAAEEDKVANALDAYHTAAAQADWDKYFDLMSNDGVFIGTDASERWEKADFEAFARRTSGWTYTPGTRHISFTPSGNVAWFDEALDSEAYGTCRGTGVLIRTEDGWKVSQYHLTFPIPNELVGGITGEIKEFESLQ